jgi:hypothetical protein
MGESQFAAAAELVRVLACERPQKEKGNGEGEVSGD